MAKKIGGLYMLARPIKVSEELPCPYCRLKLNTHFERYNHIEKNHPHEATQQLLEAISQEYSKPEA